MTNPQFILSVCLKNGVCWQLPFWYQPNKDAFLVLVSDLRASIGEDYQTFNNHFNRRYQNPTFSNVRDPRKKCCTLRTAFIYAQRQTARNPGGLFETIANGNASAIIAIGFFDAIDDETRQRFAQEIAPIAKLDFRFFGRNKDKSEPENVQPADDNPGACNIYRGCGFDSWQ